MWGPKRNGRHPLLAGTSGTPPPGSTTRKKSAANTVAKLEGSERSASAVKRASRTKTSPRASEIISSAIIGERDASNATHARGKK